MSTKPLAMANASSIEEEEMNKWNKNSRKDILTALKHVIFVRSIRSFVYWYVIFVSHTSHITHNTNFNAHTCTLVYTHHS